MQALEGFDLAIAPGMLAALVGPDGAGKTTFLRLGAGLMQADNGELEGFGDRRRTADPQSVQDRIGYMPQRFGLYEDLTVQENLDLYADLHGVTREERKERYAQLMEMTALGRFTKRLAGQLSGGMKQKLGLACTLIRAPALLLLDEPTVGVDPLSRRELWQIILAARPRRGANRPHQHDLLGRGRALPESGRHARGQKCSRRVRPTKSVASCGRPHVSGRAARRRAGPRTAGVAVGRCPSRRCASRRGPRANCRGGRGGTVRLRAKRFGHVPVRGSRAPLRRRVHDPAAESGPAHSFAAGSMTLAHPIPHDNQQAVVEVHDLVRRFGNFTAVDHVSFEVHRGEIFGLLGPNGAGKTTTFRMLCGLLPATGGTLRVAGVDLRHARASARERIGYVAQKFSLYGQLTVVENLDFFGSALWPAGPSKNVNASNGLWTSSSSSRSRGLPSGQLPGGYKQRLSMAAALLHEPEILFLDEPTSGVDPLARREFWQRITALARQGVTVIVTTHFMEEAEYCDRIAILDAGQVLAQGTPAEVRKRAHPEPGRTPNMEDAFIAIVEESRAGSGTKSAHEGGAA